MLESLTRTIVGLAAGLQCMQNTGLVDPTGSVCGYRTAPSLTSRSERLHHGNALEFVYEVKDFVLRNLWEFFAQTKGLHDGEGECRTESVGYRW